MDNVGSTKTLSIIDSNQEKDSRKFPPLKSLWIGYLQEIKARTLTLPTILLLIYTLPSTLCTVVIYNLAKDIIAPPGDKSCFHPHPEVANETYSIVTIFENALFLLVPVAGWIADTKIGRKTAITLSLWIGWIGTLLQSLSACFQYSSCGTLASIGKYGLSGIALLFLLVSLAFLYANVLAFGMDQLMTASSVKLRAFIYWYVWIFFLGGNSTSYTSFLSITSYYKGSLSVSTLAFALFSLSLCLHFQLQHKFDSIRIDNAYKTVYGVLKYAFQNKYPRNRSALTYWEDKVPKRIDFAKDKFGGPFSHENVENVKTFLRILVILAALCPFLISDPIINGIISFIPQFKGASTDLKGNAVFTVWVIGDDVILILVPLLEFIVLPLFPKLEYFLINPLKGLGLAMICIITAIFSIFLFDLIGRFLTEEDVPCYSEWTSTDPYINLNYWVLLIPAVLSGVADMLTFICIFEFLCSQAPFGMKGMLIGLFWFLRAILIDVGSVLSIMIHNLHPEGPSKLSCTSWFMLILGVILVSGFVLYALLAHWYVKRVRDDELNLRTAIEEHFEQQLISEAKHKQNVSNTIFRKNPLIVEEDEHRSSFV